MPAGPYEYNDQYRDVIPIARIAQIYCGHILWVRSSLKTPQTGAAASQEFKYTVRFLIAHATLAMKFMEFYPQLPDPSELPEVHPDIERRKDWLTREIFETMQKSLDLRSVSVRDFWKWLWPLRPKPSYHDVSKEPIAVDAVEDICVRAACFELLETVDAPDWFLERMRPQ